MCRFIGMTGYPTAMTRRVMSEFDLDVTLSYAPCTLLDACITDAVLPLAQERGVGVINAAAVALGLLTQAGPPLHIAQVVGEGICTVARRIVEVSASWRRCELSGQPILHPAFRLRHHVDRDY
jgi:L-galactose dehydrogenase